MSLTNQSHPKSLRKQVKDALRFKTSIKPNDHLLLAVSGGSDSMALLYALSTLREELDFKLSAITINHGLRQESVNEVKLVQDYCQSLHVDCYVDELNLKSGSNTQERAREARYKSFNYIKDIIEADFIITAHHKEDRAETILMRILTGTSVSGLDVLRYESNGLLRPMIGAYKRDVMLYIERNNIPYVEDPSNKHTEKYLRSKMRYDIMPELLKINPNLAEALCKLSDNAISLKNNLS